MLLFETKTDFTTTLRKALTDITPQWEQFHGLIVPGSHTPNQVNEKIAAIRRAREEQIPFLGICFGHQLAAIEYARNVLCIEDATSEEFGQGTFVVKKRPEGLKVGEHEGETYWSNYDVDPDIMKLWKKPKWFFTAPFHSEYQSTRNHPHSLLLDFLFYAHTMQNRA